MRCVAIIEMYWSKYIARSWATKSRGARDMRDQVHCEIMRDEVARCGVTSEVLEQVHCEIMRDEDARCGATSEVRVQVHCEIKLES